MSEDVKGDEAEAQEWLDALDSVEAFEGLERVDALLESVVTSARRKGAKLPFAANTAYVNTIHPDEQPASSRRSQARSDDPSLHPLERGGDRAASEQGILRARRPYREFPVGRDAVRYRFHAFLARPRRIARRRPRLFPGPQLAGHLRPRLSRGSAERGSTAQVPAGGRRQGASVLSASLADARFLAVPHGFDGPGAVDGDLSGPLPPLFAGSRDRRHARAQGLVLLRRRRDGRAGIAGRDLARRAREARQPDFRHQLQSAASRRPGARQRQDRPGAGSRLPRRRLERDQVPLGLELGSVAGARYAGQAATADGGMRRRRIPGLQVEGRRLYPQELLRPPSRDRGDGRGLDRRPDLGADARRPRSDQGLRRLQSGRRPQGPTDRHPRQDRERLRHGRGGRGPDDRPPAEEDRRSRAEILPRSPSSPDLRRGDLESPVPDAAERQRGDELSAGSTARRSAARCRRAAAPARRSKFRLCPRSTRCCTRPPRGARFRRRWRSCAS